jgi:hypothetical protein
MLSPGSITNSVPDPDKAVRLQRDIQREAQEQSSAPSLVHSTLPVGTLATALQFASQSAYANTFTIPGDVSASVVSLTVPIPDGFTTAQVTATASVTGQNFTTVTSYLHCYVLINGASGGTGGLGGRAVNGESTGATSSKTTTLTGLTPGVITVEGYAAVTSSGAPPTPPWLASLANQASLNVGVIFIR